ncbi:hypothetical protein HG536_0A01880 [Torulaspora globosa]|uniref:SET domain-containing protein n=1 Tax=Torulaspora globosa TaxID=48254 RepID=A0A7G3ZA35_9SACH|nr:uncharacterized protein HG536_0A01880 [Torulaspora globosa]QLL30371.1 hypothetical protein HG536_0A01880 [Torulaspora globosa]
MPSEDQLQKFIEFCRKNGANLDERISFKITRSAGVTAVATSAIHTQDPLISVPEKLLITRELAEKEFGVNSATVSSGNSNALLQLYIAKMKFEPSAKPFHKPYFDILPDTLNQPYFWSLKELELLKGTDLYLLLKENLRRIIREWWKLLHKLQIDAVDKEIYEGLESSEDFDVLRYVCDYREKHQSFSWKSFAGYLWATGIFTSRAFPRLVIDKACSDLNEAFLYPVVDLLNHKNDTQVKWTFEHEKVCFITSETLKEGDEVFNNYGDKSNEDLLLCYGFLQESNRYDRTRLTLRLDSETIEQALASNLGMTKENVIADDCAQFLITAQDPLPNAVANFFGYLCKLKSEAEVSLRSFLEGQDELSSILVQKLDFFKVRSKFSPADREGCNPDVIQMIKKYMSSERKLIQGSLEYLQKRQKDILKSNSALMVSFKSIFKMDRKFADSLLLSFGVVKYEDLVAKNRLRESLLLWIVRAANKDSYPQKFQYTVPEFIFDTFQEVSGSIVIEKNDVAEFMEFYKNLFPGLTEKIPEVFGPGNWGIRQFIVADTVMDRVVYTRKLTHEPYFIVRVPFKL